MISNKISDAISFLPFLRKKMGIVYVVAGFSISFYSPFSMCAAST